MKGPGYRVNLCTIFADFKTPTRVCSGVQSGKKFPRSELHRRTSCALIASPPEKRWDRGRSSLNVLGSIVPIIFGKGAETPKATPYKIKFCSGVKSPEGCHESVCRQAVCPWGNLHNSRSSSIIWVSSCSGVTSQKNAVHFSVWRNTSSVQCFENQPPGSSLRSI